MSIESVAREVLVRYLDTWAPVALHATRGATFALIWTGQPDLAAAEAALRVFAEFGDRLRGGRRLAVVLVAPEVTGLRTRAAELQRELRTPAEMAVHAVAGVEKLDAALKAAGSAGAPLLSYVDSPEPVRVDRGKPSEMLVLTGTGNWDRLRTGLGFPLTAGVDLVDEDGERLLAFGTGSAKSLEAFKNELWAADEYAGVRYRDPHDPDGHLMDISLEPNPGALRRELLDRLAEGDATVTELKRYALTDTIFRAGDATRVLQQLLHSGALTRTPDSGKLSGDVVIRATGG